MEVVKLKFGPFSSSRLETAYCGYSFYSQYFDPDRSKREDSVESSRGNVAHEVFEHITADFKRGKTVFSEKEIRGWIAEKVNAYPMAYTEIDDIIDMAKRYIDRPPKVLTEDAGIELRLAVKAFKKEDETLEFKECEYDDPDAFFRGRADILVISDDLTSALVYDHKTQPNIEEADTFQMGLYAWTIWKIHPYLKEIRTVLHFARYGSYSEPVVWTVEDLLHIEDQLLTKIEVIEMRTNFNAQPHKVCQYCPDPIMLKCPALAEAIEVNRETGDYRKKLTDFKCLGDTQAAVKFAGLSHLLSEMNNKIKKGLREHVKAYGAVAIPGMVFEFRPDVKVHWDKVNKTMRDKVYELFARHGVDPKTFMSFNQTSSAKAFSHENQGFVRELAALLPQKTATTFKGYKS